MFEKYQAKQALHELLPNLKNLEEQLKEVERISNPIDRIVKFFDVMSPWDDNSQSISNVIAKFEKAGSHHAEKLEDLKNLRAHINNSGRDPHGWNRTTTGETVTSQKVFLGNTHGLFTLSAAKWQESFNRPNPPADTQKIIENQAKTFVSSHIGPMREIIGSLEDNGAHRPAKAIHAGSKYHQKLTQ